MAFDDGLLTIKDADTDQTLQTYGFSGHPDAIMTLQTDGNLVIYGTGNDPLWASGTNH
jgi:hypothetical protein